MNDFQKAFMRRLAELQHENVDVALIDSDDKSMEERLYDISYNLLSDILTLIDGYDSRFKYNIQILNENGENLKSNPHIELHDKCEDFFRFS